MLRSPQLFRAKVSGWIIHPASVDSPRRAREILVPHGRNTMAAASPYTSRWVGDPAVPASLSSVRRFPIGWFPRSLRALTEEAFPHPSRRDAELRTSPTRTMKGGDGRQVQLISGSTLKPDHIRRNCTARWRRYFPHRTFPSMLVFPLSFDIR
jgi:hypothetical protein